MPRFSPYKLQVKSSLLVHLQGSSHTHPNPSPSKYTLPTVSAISQFVHEGEVFENTRHIKMDFELFRNGQQCSPSTEQRIAIMALFPTSFQLTWTPTFLVIACFKLPAKPWPVTVAGIPLYLTTDAEFSPMDLGRTASGPKASVEASIEPWQTPRIGTFKKPFALFDELGANIHQLEWIGWGFLALGVSEPYPDRKKRLPFTVNQMRIGYIFGVQTVHEKALRRKPPIGRTADNEAYGYLRPGVMIASKGEPYDVMTTSGVCLRSPSGSKYITVAKHGFPWGVGDHVLHPNRNGHMIGEVVKVFGETDIALAKLAGVHYLRETFSEINAAVQPFTSLVDFAEHQVGEFVFMDTPYNGRCEGVLMKSVCRRLPADEPADNVECVVGSFTYFGNGGDTLFDGCCGAVVWNSKYGVLGQFRFQQEGTDELCYCPSFSMLKGLGYSLSEA